MRLKAYICPAVIVAALLFNAFTIRAGQLWPDDFAMYVHEAQNIAHHVALSHTGYIYDPLNPSLGPRLYPPIFPAFLVPAYDLGGTSNLLPMKLEIVLFYIATLVVLWRGLGKDLSLPSQIALLAIVGFNPILWSYKDRILSDLPFAFFFLAALAFADWCVSNPAPLAKNVWRVVALASLVYLSYGTRTMGIVLVPAFVLIGLWEWKRSGKMLIASAICGLIPCLIQAKLFGGESSYMDQLRLGPAGFLHAVLSNLVGYSWSFATFLENPYSKVFRDLLFAVVTLLAVAGYVNRVRLRIRVYEAVIPFYLAIVLLWPNPAGVRYLIPIFPLYIFYFLDGAEYFSSRVTTPRVATPKLAPSLVAAVSLLVGVTYIAQYAHTNFGPFPEGVATGPSQALFTYIQSNTSPDDVVIFRRPRALALFTGRNSSVYPEPRYLSQFPGYFESIHADYLVEAPSLDDSAYDTFVESGCKQKSLVFSNPDFRVYRVDAAALQACAVPAYTVDSLVSREPDEPN